MVIEWLAGKVIACGVSMAESIVEQSKQSRSPVLEIQDLAKHFPVRGGFMSRVSANVYAVDGVSFSIQAGETLGLVGESGCGKSTVGKTVLRLLDPTAGRVILNGEDITKVPRESLREQRRQMQIVFQDPYSSLNPRMPSGRIVGEPLENYGLNSGKAKDEAVVALFERVGLRAEQTAKYPHEFSGGQRQRLGIARALALNPDLIVADEPVSALDVSIQAQILNLLKRLQHDQGLTFLFIAYLFISHDLAVVEHISHRIAVMYLGKIVELTDKRSLFEAPQHPYTEALLSAVPVPDPTQKRDRIILRGDVPSPMNPPPGCTFHTRCPYVEDICRVEVPPLQEVRPSHYAACHLREAISS